MKKVPAKQCSECGNGIDKDIVALNRKLIRREISSFLCKDCLASVFECAPADLDMLIQDFKEQGCSLFVG